MDSAHEPINADTSMSAGEFVTESRDPDVLQELLARARERLNLYAGFDTIIQDQIAQSATVVSETVAIREAARQAEQARDASLRHASALASAMDDVRSHLEAARRELGAAVSAIDAAAQEAPGNAPARDRGSSVSVTSALVEPWQSSARDEPATAPTPAPPTPQVDPEAKEPAKVSATNEGAPPTFGVDVIVHGVDATSTALALQDALKALPGVRVVETREFAAGELRMHVTTTSTIERDDLGGWMTKHQGAWQSHGPATVEITLG